MARPKAQRKKNISYFLCDFDLDRDLVCLFTFLLEKSASRFILGISASRSAIVYAADSNWATFMTCLSKQAGKQPNHAN